MQSISSLYIRGCKHLSPYNFRQKALFASNFKRPKQQNLLPPEFSNLFLDDSTIIKTTKKNKKFKKWSNKEINLRLKMHSTTDELFGSKSSAIEDLIREKRMDEALIFIQNADHLDSYHLRSSSLKALCSVAARNGRIDLVKKVQNITLQLHSKFYHNNLRFEHYLSQSEYNAGFYQKAFNSIAKLYQVELSDEPYGDENYHKNLSFSNIPRNRNIDEEQWKVICHKKLKDTSCLLVKKVVSIEDPLLWNQVRISVNLKVECLVRLLIFHYNVIPPCFSLWLTFFTHKHLERADNLFEKEVRVRSYIPKRLQSVLRTLFSTNSTELVHHLITQLLKYDLKESLAPVVALLIAMHSSAGNSTAVLEALKFSCRLNIALPANAILRAQQTLYEAHRPLPLELMHLKYPSYRVYENHKPPPLNF